MFEQERPLSGLGNCANSGYFVGSFRYLANVNLLLFLRPQRDLTNNMDMGRCRRRPTDSGGNMREKRSHLGLENDAPLSPTLNGDNATIAPRLGADMRR